MNILLLNLWRESDDFCTVAQVSVKHFFSRCSAGQSCRLTVFTFNMQVCHFSTLKTPGHVNTWGSHVHLLKLFSIFSIPSFLYRPVLLLYYIFYNSVELKSKIRFPLDNFQDFFSLFLYSVWSYFCEHYCFLHLDPECFLQDSRSRLCFHLQTQTLSLSLCFNICCFFYYLWVESIFVSWLI